MGARLDPLALQVEAVLFAAGKPLSVHEISVALAGADSRQIQGALRALRHSYAGRETALELRRAGERYALQLREAYRPAARSVSPMELPPRVLKALTLVAYHQPLRQSLLVKMVGFSAYADVAHLTALGLVRSETDGATLALRTTRLFAEHFGFPSTRPDQIREYLARRLQVEPSLPVDPAPSPKAEAVPATGTPASDQ